MIEEVNTTTWRTETRASAEHDDSWDIRILRRVGTIASLVRATTSPGLTRRIALIDTETTSTNPQRAALIDIAAAIVLVDEAGEIVGLEQTRQQLRDPGLPIPAKITELTGITDAMVKGQQLSTARWEAMLQGCTYIVAHNAAYDAPIIERHLPGLRGLPWACSMREIQWAALGFDGAKLGHLVMQAGFFNDAHRAAADVASLAHLLAVRMPDGRPTMATLLESASRQTVRIDAKGADFSVKERLKERNYRWDPVIRAWWTELDEVQVDEERRWLEFEIGCRNPAMTVMTARTRFR